MIIGVLIDGHRWAQGLPLRSNTLVCMCCDARTPMGTPWPGNSCAERLSAQRGFSYVRMANG